ncbi:MAG: hypothetical protein EPO12_16235 [Aquabacterium sp.]|jgi:hypothetical protein|nr:MAG: hypothetical protein EPO12_16235 [Aquabacterium sp.]
MSFVRILLLIGAVGLGWHEWQKHQADKIRAVADAGTSATGFVPTAMPTVAKRNVVLILAPIDCPSDAAQRADALASELTRRGIPNERGASFSLSLNDPNAEERAAADRAVAVLNGTIPAVFINGMGKANPSADEVAAEFTRTR